MFTEEAVANEEVEKPTRSLNETDERFEKLDPERQSHFFLSEAIGLNDSHDHSDDRQDWTRIDALNLADVKSQLHIDPRLEIERSGVELSPHSTEGILLARIEARAGRNLDDFFKECQGIIDSSVFAMKENPLKSYKDVPFSYGQNITNRSNQLRLISEVAYIAGRTDVLEVFYDKLTESVPNIEDEDDSLTRHRGSDLFLALAQVSQYLGRNEEAVSFFERSMNPRGNLQTELQKCLLARQLTIPTTYPNNSQRFEVERISARYPGLSEPFILGAINAIDGVDKEGIIKNLGAYANSLLKEKSFNAIPIVFRNLVKVLALGGHFTEANAFAEHIRSHALFDAKLILAEEAHKRELPEEIERLKALKEIQPELKGLENAYQEHIEALRGLLEEPELYNALAPQLQQHISDLLNPDQVNERNYPFDVDLYHRVMEEVMKDPESRRIVMKALENRNQNDSNR